MRAVLVLPLLWAATAAASPCQDAATQAAAAQGVPEGLLQSIVRVESGGEPYAVDVDGTPHRFSDKQDAIDFVRAADASGARFIDIGCFQIDLFYHPDAFPDLETAFEPQANAAYAARFLTELRGGDPGWDDAVAAYHSRTPELGAAYRSRVLGGDAPVWVAGVRVETPDAGAETIPGLPRVFVP
jgi:soluble lytic murein transglycosylase-like protein